jgi:uncharacterized Zn-binding protein involved in type VI secretion
MPAAARVGDPTGHGIPLAGPGSPNVLIGGKLAWRISDFHTCPLYDGKSPHGGGLVTVGCPKVLINGFAAAKMGDLIAEAAGPPNPITAGEPTVLICEPPSGVAGAILEQVKEGSPSSLQGQQAGYASGSKAETSQEEEISYIKGQVLDDSTGEPVEGIPIRILGDNGKLYQTKTDDKGFYEVLDVPKGKYRIKIDLEDQGDVETETEV